jgi:hypothetical protein
VTGRTEGLLPTQRVGAKGKGRAEWMPRPE